MKENIDMIVNNDSINYYKATASFLRSANSDS